MKPVYLIFLSMLCYTCNNILLPKISTYHPLMLSVIFSAICFILSLSILIYLNSFTNTVITIPLTKDSYIFLTMGIIYVLGEFLYFIAFQKGATPFDSTTVFLLEPILILLITYVIFQNKPLTPSEILSYIFAGISVALSLNSETK